MIGTTRVGSKIPSVVERTWKICAICLEEMADKDLRKHTSCSCLLCQTCIEVLLPFTHLIVVSSFNISEQISAIYSFVKYLVIDDSFLK